MSRASSSLWYSSMPWKSFSFRCTVTCLLSSCRFLSLWAKAWAAEQGRGKEHELRDLQAQAQGPGILGGQGSGRGLGPRVLGLLASHTPYMVCPSLGHTCDKGDLSTGHRIHSGEGPGNTQNGRGWAVDQREHGKDAGAGCTTILLGGCFSPLLPAMRKAGGEEGIGREEGG